MPDRNERSSPASDPDGARTTTTTYTYRRAWLPLLLAAIVVPLLVATLAVVTRRDHVQDDLSARARTALAAAGVPDAQVSFNGRDATIKGVPARSAAAARRAVLHLRGVRVASVSTVPDGTPAPAPSAGAPAPLRIAEVGDQVTLTGTVPDTGTEGALVRAATGSAAGRPVVDRLTVSAGSAPSASAADVSKLVAALGSGSDRGLSYDGKTITLTGTVPDAATQAAIEQRARVALPSATIDNRFTVTVAPAAKADLQARVNARLTALPVTFDPDSASLSAQGLSTVQAVAVLLRGTPGLRLEVDGHVANTGSTVPDAGTLSQQRANTVKATLAHLGVRASITAKGFGDSRPIASNSTPDGQAKNRRVEIRLL